MNRHESATRTASAIYHLGWSSLSDSEESALQNYPEFRNLVEDYLQQLRATGRIRKTSHMFYVILDKPSMEYSSLLVKCRQEHGAVFVDFLCSFIPETSHFKLCILDEQNIMYRCLNIPVKEWAEWKKHPAYEGSNKE